MHSRITYLASIVLGGFFLVMTACSSGGGGVSGSSSNINLGPPASSSSASVQVQNPNLALSGTSAVTAKFVDASNQPVAGLAVTFSTTLGTLTPADGKATTDATGTATVQLLAGSVSGPGLITASASINGKQVVQSGTFTVSLPTLALSPVSLGLATISYGGSTSVTVTVKDANGNPFTAQSVEVSFTSVQAAAGKATITSKVNTNTANGTATATYQANTNTGADTITASISGSSVQANITVNALNAQSITFVSATPTNIGLKGMGGLGITETSTVVFKVLDTSGQPKANQQVDFALNTQVGGLSLLSSSASSDSGGLVSTVVQSGTFATPVRVTATLRGLSPAISTQSDQLVVSTGVPAQDGFSLSIVTLNPECYSIDGITDLVTVRLSDHFHNPVPDGTAISFTTNGGSITPSCTTVGGACTVTWTSQNPRPAVPGINPGRVTILAYAVGEEAFTDLNGNGVADAGEFTDDPEAYRDDNENGVRDANEPFIDFNGNGAFDGPDGCYNGVLQGSAYVGKCARSKNVFSNLHIVMATSAATITNTAGNTITVPNGGNSSFAIIVQDLNGNTMPAGTTVAFSLVTIGTGPTFALTASPFTFPNSAADHGAVLPVRIDNPGDNGSPAKYATAGQLTVTVTSPKGLITTAVYGVSN